MCSIILVAKFLEKLHYLATKQEKTLPINTFGRVLRIFVLIQPLPTS